MDVKRQRHVGYEPEPWAEALFDPAALEAVQVLVRRDTGVRVPLETVGRVVGSVFAAYRPLNVNPASRYVVAPGGAEWDDAWQRVLREAAALLSSGVRDDLDTRRHNATLSRAEATLLGVDDSPLRAHAPLKLRERRPQPFLFHMRF